MGWKQRAKELRDAPSLRREDRILYRSTPPPRSDQAAYVQWLFVQARQDYLEAKARRAAKERIAEREAAKKGPSGP